MAVHMDMWHLQTNRERCFHEIEPTMTRNQEGVMTVVQYMEIYITLGVTLKNVLNVGANLPLIVVIRKDPSFGFFPLKMRTWYK